MKRNTLILIICIVAIVAVGAVVSGVAYALWRESKVKEATVTALEPANPSLRFQIFHPLDASGNLIEFKPYSVNSHGRILPNSYTLKNGTKAYDLYEIEEDEIGGDRYMLVSYKTEDPTLYVISGRHPYDYSNDGDLYYLNYTTSYTELYVNNTGTPADNEVVGTITQWYMADGTALLWGEHEGVRELYFLDPDSGLYQWQGQVVCSQTTTLGHYVYFHDLEENDYYLANTEQIEEGDYLYINEYAVYDPNSAEDVEEYGVLEYSQTTSGLFRLYNKTDSETYEYATVQQVELRSQLLYTGDFITYAIATFEQLDAGINIFFGGDTYTEATAAQISAGDNLFYSENETTFALATAEQIAGGSNLYYRQHGGVYVPATAAQIDARIGLFYESEGEYTQATEAQIDAGSNLFYLYYVPATTDQIVAGRRIYGGNETKSYALVGYTGTAISEVVVPEKIIDEATNREYYITKICASNAYPGVEFYRNEIVTSIVIPASVETIGSLTFADMTNLHDLYFTGAGSIEVGDRAFLGCVNLTNIYVMPSTTLMDTNGAQLTWQSAVFEKTGLTAESFKSFTDYQPLTPSQEQEGEGEGD